MGPLNNKQEEYLNDILNSGNHLLSLINDVLDLAKVEAGKMEFNPESFSIKTAVEEVSSVVNSIAKKKKIKIDIGIADNIDQINIDKHKFKQILYNLLSNAIKFTPEGGYVNVKTTKDGNNLCLMVKDTGIGISREGLKKLFTPFVQLDSSLSRKHEGSGLGLALTRKIVELQNGSIDAESEPGKGSIFKVLLPTSWDLKY